jgi:hypothetical protein
MSPMEEKRITKNVIIEDTNFGHELHELFFNSGIAFRFCQKRFVEFQ